MNKKLMLPLAGVTLFCGCNEKMKQDDRMNILFIMSDDHSYQTISAYDNRFINTPNIDRIGNEGVIFTNSFVANSISGPSRACALTGKHSHKNGYMNNIDCTFDSAQMTFPKLLQKAGYETAIIGKWHLISTPAGFDYWDILPGQGDYYNPKFIENGKEKQIEGYVTNITTDLALNWLESREDKEKPFCLMLHHKAPHRTWMPDLCDLGKFDSIDFPIPETFFDTYENRVAAQQQEMTISSHMDLVYDLKMADKENEIHSSYLEKWGRLLYNNLTEEQKKQWDAYYDPIIDDFKRQNLSEEALSLWKYRRYMSDYLSVIYSLDKNIGRVLDYLDKTGLSENTLVVYVSDQGFYMGEHGWFDKRFMYEESFRTPLLMRLPNGKRGTIDQLVQNIDYAPTFLELAGVEIPEEIQGKSLLPLLKGEEVEDWRTSLYYHFYEYPSEHAVKRHYGIRTERYKLIHFYNDIDTWELYDLQADPNEMNNIYDEKSSLCDSLKRELNVLRKHYEVEE
ncbi:MAG: sulfatase [Paludibacteraceae bacterium]|nr:sulfatase [Paludibacteraceae bacterium]